MHDFDLDNIRERHNDIAHLAGPWTDDRAADDTIEIRTGDDDRIAVLPDWAGSVGHFLINARQDIASLIAEVDRLRAELARVTEERDLAVAHDTQPYPTQHAYDALAAAHAKHLKRADAAEAELQRVTEESAAAYSRGAEDMRTRAIEVVEEEVVSTWSTLAIQYIRDLPLTPSTPLTADTDH
jgi:F0F1-type ATP synthase membrane subunit b/b'